MRVECESCNNFVYDDETDAYYCEADMDEDDYARLLQNERSSCPFWYSNDEYKTVRRQN